MRQLGASGATCNILHQCGLRHQWNNRCHSSDCPAVWQWPLSCVSSPATVTTAQLALCHTAAGRAPAPLGSVGRFPSCILSPLRRGWVDVCQLPMVWIPVWMIAASAASSPMCTWTMCVHTKGEKGLTLSHPSSFPGFHYCVIAFSSGCEHNGHNLPQGRGCWNST